MAAAAEYQIRSRKIIHPGVGGAESLHRSAAEPALLVFNYYLYIHQAENWMWRAEGPRQSAGMWIFKTLVEHFGCVSAQQEFTPAAATRLSVCGAFFFFPVGDTWMAAVKWPQGRCLPARELEFTCKRVRNAYCHRNKRPG